MINAGMVKLADTSDLSPDAFRACGFESHYQHHIESQANIKNI